MNVARRVDQRIGHDQFRIGDIGQQQPGVLRSVGVRRFQPEPGLVAAHADQGAAPPFPPSELQAAKPHTKTAKPQHRSIRL